MDHEHDRVHRSQRQRREVLDGVKRRIGQQVHVRAVSGVGSEQERVAVRLGFGDIVAADVAAGATQILDHDVLAQRLGHLLCDLAAHRIRRRTGRVRHDQAQTMVGIGLGDGDGRQQPAEGRKRQGRLASSHVRSPAAAVPGASTKESDGPGV